MSLDDAMSSHSSTCQEGSGRGGAPSGGAGAGSAPPGAPASRPAPAPASPAAPAMLGAGCAAAAPAEAVVPAWAAAPDEAGGRSHPRAPQQQPQDEARRQRSANSPLASPLATPAISLGGVRDLANVGLTVAPWGGTSEAGSLASSRPEDFPAATSLVGRCSAGVVSQASSGILGGLRRPPPPSDCSDDAGSMAGSVASAASSAAQAAQVGPLGAAVVSLASGIVAGRGVASGLLPTSGAASRVKDSFFAPGPVKSALFGGGGDPPPATPQPVTTPRRTPGNTPRPGGHALSPRGHPLHGSSADRRPARSTVSSGVAAGSGGSGARLARDRALDASMCQLGVGLGEEL